MSLKRKTSRVLAAPIAALALVAAGCGDSEEETTSTSTASSRETQSKTDWIAAADAICTQTGAEVSAVVQEQDTPPTTNEDLVQFFADVTIPALQAQFEEIDALPPPEGDEEAAQAIADAGLAGTEEAAMDPNLLVVPQGFPTPLDEFSELAQDFGMKVCGGGEAPAGRPSSS